MASKKRLVITPREEPEAEVPEDPRPPWLRAVYAKYWFFVLAIAVTAMAPLEVLRHEEWGGIRWSLALITMFASLTAFGLIYVRVWWKGWGDD